jgi:hypothetical protein
MPRSTRSSTPPQGGGKRSRSSSQSKGGGRKANASVPMRASKGIQRFFGGKIEVLMLLEFLIGTETSFNWKAYQGTPMNLPEGQLTAEVVANWMLNVILRKPAPGEQQIPDQVWHRVLQFLRENAQFDDLKPLFEFIKKYQKDMMDQNVIPNWVQICLVPLCDSDAASISSILTRSFFLYSEFWQNAIEGLTPALLPFWFTEQTSHVWQNLIFQLLQHPLSDEIKQIVKAFFEGKPFDFFMEISMDILILLINDEVVNELNVLRYLFSPKRRNLGFLRIFVEESSIQNQIIQNFLKKHFAAIFNYISRTHPSSVEIEFQRVFLFPHSFFKTLLETPDILVQSNIDCPEMENFLNLFCWNTNTLLSTYMHLNDFVSQIMKLPDDWKFLFVQFWRCEPRRFEKYYVSELIKCVRQQKRCLFSKTLASMMRVYMKQVVANTTPEVREYFFKWLLEQSQTIQSHFPLTKDDLQFCLHEFPNVQTKKTLFWWLFTVYAAENDQCSDRELTVNMTVICQEFGLKVTEEELCLRAQNGLNPIGAVCALFNVITLNFEFGSCKVTRNFVSVCYCDPFETDGSNPFRGFIHRLRMSLNAYINPKQVPNCGALIALIATCEARPEFFKEIPQNDRAFLIKLFGEYLPELSLKEEELVPLLHRLSELMPENVKQAMFESCLQIKLLHNETLESKQSCEQKEANSYEAQCSICASYLFPTELGLDGHGRAVCRRCSQANGMPILTTLSGLPFGRL